MILVETPVLGIIGEQYDQEDIVRLLVAVAQSEENSFDVLILTVPEFGVRAYGTNPIMAQDRLAKKLREVLSEKSKTFTIVHTIGALQSAAKRHRKDLEFVQNVNRSIEILRRQLPT